MAVPNHQATVESVRQKYLGCPSKNACVEICNEVAWIHRAEGFGIAEKTSGTLGTRHDGQTASIDGLVYRPPQGGPENFIDILFSADATAPPCARAQWIVHETNIRKFIPPIAPQTAPPTPEPEPPPTGDYVTQAQFAAYRQAIDQRFQVLESRVTLLEVEPSGPTLDEAIQAVVDGVVVDFHETGRASWPPHRHGVDIGVALKRK